MLTGDLSIVVYDRHGNAAPDRLSRRTHAHYAGYAERMLAVYRTGVGRARRELRRSIEGIFAHEPDCDNRRVRAFCKLLDDASEYDTDPGGKASKLRLAVFERAAKRHPLVREPDRLFETSEASVKADIARDVGRAWEEVEADLYADVMEFQRLKAFHGYPAPEALLSRYNVAQVQACLYRAERMIIDAAGDFKTILRYLKLAKLLHDIRRTGPASYRIEVSGPATVLSETRRYGVSMARFLPALLACKGWRLEAALRTPWGDKGRFTLSAEAGLRSHLPPPAEFDSTVEERFAMKFNTRREGWTLFREAVIVHEGQTTFVPDFVFRHEDGTEVLFEIVGFWTPAYLARKRDTYRRFRDRSILMAVPSRSLREAAEIPEDVLVYRSSLKIGPVIEALERMRSSQKADAGG